MNRRNPEAARPAVTDIEPPPEKLEWGAHSYAWNWPAVHDYGLPEGVRVGRYCSVAEDVEFLVGGEHRLNRMTAFPFSARWGTDPDPEWPEPFSRGPIDIGSDVWIGRGARILGGVRVGEGAVVAAYSVVTKDVLPYRVVGGNPARELRQRFSDQTIAELLHIAWWDWSDELVREAVPVLTQPDPEVFIAWARERVPMGGTPGA